MKNKVFWTRIMEIAVILAVMAFFACDNGSTNSGGETGSETEGETGDKTLSGTITISPSSAKVGTELTAVYSGSEAITYQWKQGTTNVGTNANKYTPAEAGYYTVTVSASGYVSKTSGVNVTNYYIGDIGPGGGMVFYDKGNVSDGWRYLEAALENIYPNMQWASPAFYPSAHTYGTGDWVDIPGTEEAIGTGKANTAAILAIDANAPAAKACVDYRGGDKDDWFLPSKNELYRIYDNRNRFPVIIDSGTFSSSTQKNISNAWVYSFAYNQWLSDGGSALKAEYNCVRPVRAF